MGNNNGWLNFEHLAEEKQIDAVKPPSMYKVILNNDDYTPMEFVIDVLQKFFSYDIERATQLMLTVHYQGKAICGVFTAEVAETKVVTCEPLCEGERASVALYARKSLD
jgi:ATP-dependent Clp protease adaptor protein ClpS